ncbi:MAG: triose-phosphate isomerase [Gemmatimonadetes bacterium]|nr:triose-phosphate isomerase [Gemmatimonadota bacterium]
MKVVAGNWKMHMDPGAAARFFTDFRADQVDGAVRIVVFPPAISLPTSRQAAPDRVEIGVQNIHPAPSGAFTGECSAEMAAGAGASLVLIGHSERRHVFGETDEETGLKVSAGLRAGLIPVVCVGETLEERRGGRLDQVLRRQVAAVRPGLEGAHAFMIAYEPVWAIGTGETATPEDASEAHAVVRDALGDLGAAPVLYGGSVKPGNAQALMATPGVDGVLVGGASLDPDSFLAIARAA